MEEVWDLLATLATKDIKLSVEDGKLSCYAPKQSLTAELTNGITQFKPEIIDLLRNRDEAARSSMRPGSFCSPAEFPLSVGENSHYILQKLNPKRSHAVPICIKIDAEIDREALAQAWNCVLDRYPILSARIVENEGVPHHCLDEQCRSTIHREHLPYDDDKQVAAYFQDQVLEPFDLNCGPLSRITLFTWGERNAGLFILIHHIIFDGFSTAILLKALFTYCKQIAQGGTVPARQEESGFQHFVAWEEQMLASDEGRQHAAYWKEQLRGELPGFKLLPDAPHPLPQDYKPQVLVEVLPAELSAWVRDFCKARVMQHSVFFLAAFQLLLHKYTKQKDIVAVMPVIVRPDKRFADEIGYFFNIVPIRTRFDEQPALGDFLRGVQRTMLDAVFHSAYPFPLMVNRQSTEGNAEFKIFYAYQEFVNLVDAEFASVRSEFGLAPIEGFHQKAEGELDLAFEVFNDGAAFRIHLQGNPSLYSNETLAAFVEHFCVLLQGFCADTTRCVHQYPIITERDRQRVVRDWNATDAAYPKDRCIHDFFVEQVAVQPQRTAVAFGEQALSYAELSARTQDLALYLQSLGVKPDSVVALCVERSLDMMIGIMGIVQAGGAYMPLDPDYPDDRLTYMLEDSQITIVLTQEKFRDKVGALTGADIRVISLDVQAEEIRSAALRLRERGVEFARDVAPHNVAYVIYTSGSTGKPKGALVEHRALVNRIHWMQKSYPLDSRDVVLQKTPYSFDVSVWEFFWPMMTGSSLVFAVPNGHSDVQYMEVLINTAGVTTLHYVPSMLHTFLDNARGQCGSVTSIFCSGEALDKRSVDRYRDRFPNAALHNLYGPTEAAIDVTAYDCTRLAYPFVPIGAPIDNTQIYIVDEANNPQPIGVPGELHIAGDNLARGYLNRPQLTQDRFIDNPFTPGARMYKTGDLARWLEDGNIQYLGRIDAQVKIGGVRIEAGEIEAHLNRHPEINESVVIARGPDGYKQLIAFYRAHASTGSAVVKLKQTALREHLLGTLPEYMIPAAFVSVPAIPLSSNGKVDRRALDQLDVSVESSQEYVAPRNDTERQLVDIWAEVFKQKGFVVGQANIGVNDNFFELGGNSLLATQLLYKIRRQLGVDLPVRALFEQLTVGLLADLIIRLRRNDDDAAGEPGASVAADRHDIVVPIETRGELTPLFALPGVGGNVLSFRELSKALGARQPFYALQAVWRDGRTPAPASVEETAEINLAAIRAVQTHGPYRLIGHSYGGVVAYEMARVLLERGEDVASLALLDSVAPAVMHVHGAVDEFEALRDVCIELAEQGGKRFCTPVEELRQMSAEALVDVFGRLGIDVGPDQFATIYHVFKANRRCYELYQPLALTRDIDVLLCRATHSVPGGEGLPRDYGWGAVSTRPPRIHDCDADHFSMLRGRPVVALADVLQRGWRSAR